MEESQSDKSEHSQTNTGEHAHMHTHVAHSHEQSHTSAHHGPEKIFGIDSRIILVALMIGILAITIYARLGLTSSQGLFEPDGFFYYSIIRGTIANGLHEPQYLGISGFPSHNFIGEAPGLPYLTVIFYLLLGWSGLGYLEIMRYLPVFFGVLEVILAYFLAKELSNSRLLGLLAMFFIAVSAGNIARTAALVYRGDSFIGLPIMLALLILLKGLKLENPKKVAIYAIVAAFILSTGVLVWNGSPYIVAVYMLSLALLMLYSFISWKPQLARNTLIFTAAMLLVYILQNIYILLKAARVGLVLEGTGLLIFYIPLLLLSVLVVYLIKKGRVGLLHSPKGRAIVAIIGALVVIAIVAVAFGGAIRTLEGASGVATQVNATTAAGSSYAVGATTQELQKPTFGFLFASFELGLYLAPIGAILFLLFNRRIERKRSGKTDDAPIVNPGYIVVMSYLAITAYLQYNAIRYNSLLSIPLAIMAAYAIYCLFELFSNIRFDSKKLTSYIAAAIIVIVTLAVIFTWDYRLLQSGSAQIFLLEGVLALLICIGIFADLAYSFAIRKSLALRNICVLAVLLILVFSAFYCVLESFSSSQADGINPAFLSAMTWMKANTPVNATVLALWPDGSVVEGWANRTSYMDSVGGENSTRIYYFARYLINSSPDSQYLFGIGKPQYIVARNYWLTELTGLIAEGVPQNPNNYTYAFLSAIGTPRQNATAQFYFFGNGQDNITLIGRHSNGSTVDNYTAYLGGPGATQQYALHRVVFYNTSSYTYGTYNASAYRLNYTLVVFYTGTQIEASLVTTDALYQSNLFKLLFLCTQAECPPYDNQSASIHLVYENNDTRIFKVNYT